LKTFVGLIIISLATSVLLFFVYGLFRHEPLGFPIRFQKMPVDLGNPADLPYFAAQSSAHRLLVHRELPELLGEWNLVKAIRINSFPCFASGVFCGRQLYTDSLLPVIRAHERMLAILPSLYLLPLLF
jgi:hypothetical protein